jgi:hypothetical protein
VPDQDLDLLVYMTGGQYEWRVPSFSRFPLAGPIEKVAVSYTEVILDLAWVAQFRGQQSGWAAVRRPLSITLSRDLYEFTLPKRGKIRVRHLGSGSYPQYSWIRRPGDLHLLQSSRVEGLPAA